MFHRKYIYVTILFILALTLISGSIIYHSQNSQELKVIFLDVGQGDAILISQGSYQILIDGGRNGKQILNKLGKYVPFWDRNIEVVLETHPDQDHIAGLIDVLKTYKVNTIIKTAYPSDSQTYKALEEEISKERAENIVAKKGVRVNFPNSAIFEILYPFSDINVEEKNKSNDNSVVAKIEFGENSFLLTGDLSKDSEKEIISAQGRPVHGWDSDLNLSSKVLKIAHHGSKYSTSQEFLEKVKPNDAVISVGKDNMYGHPNQEVLDLLKEKNISILRTDERGDVIYNCKKNLICDKSI